MLPPLRPAEQEIAHRTHGARPPRPAIVLTSAPPPANLPLEPDTVLGSTLAPVDVDAVDWSNLAHAHDTADDVPDLIRALMGNGEDWSDVLGELCCDDVLHQRTCYSATASTVALLARRPPLSAT